jgi:hypothetical protein
MVDCVENAKQLEISYIKRFDTTNLTKGMNVSPGGDYNVNAGVQRLKELRADPVWNAELNRKTAEGIQKYFQNNPDKRVERQNHMKKVGEKFRKDNPEQHLKNSAEGLTKANKIIGQQKKEGTYVHPKYDMTEAHKQKLFDGLREYRQHATEEELQRVNDKIREATRRHWGNMSEEEIAKRKEAISQSKLIFWEKISEAEKKIKLDQLDQARHNVDHKKRKQNQKVGLANYWTPERRKEYGEKVRERNRLKKQKREGESL